MNPANKQTGFLRSILSRSIGLGQNQPPFDQPAIASASIPASLGWYSWDLTDGLQAWANTRDTDHFNVLLRSDASSGQHERSF